VCFKSRVKREGMIDGESRPTDDEVTVYGGERVKDKVWMRLTERMREFIPKVGCCMLKRTVSNFQ